MSVAPSLGTQIGSGRVALEARSYVAARDCSTAPGWYTSASILLADVLALSAIYWIAVLTRRLINPGDVRFYVQVFPGVCLFVAAFAIQGLYPGVLLHPAEEIRRVFHGVSVVFLLFLCTTFLWHNAESYSRSVVLVIWALGAPTVLLSRKLARRALSRCDWWGVPAVVIGSGATAARILRSLLDRQLGVRVTAVVSDDHTYTYVPSNGTAHYAIMAQPSSVAEFHRMLQDQCTGYRHILFVPNIFGICSLGISAREVGGEIAFEVPQQLFHRTAGMMKRAMDLILTLPGLLILSPIFLFIAVATKMSSAGPVFYGHTRLGRNGKTFKALKFRTMFRDGDSILREYFESHPQDLEPWRRDQKLKTDPRVTPIGKWLRRYSLDELPQLLNVLLGQMSLVGPRPIVSSELLKYGHAYDLYSRVRPGITGLWQVSGRNNTTYPERVAFDEYYVRNWSIWLDAYIFVRTLSAVINAEGAY